MRLLASLRGCVLSWAATISRRPVDFQRLQPDKDRYVGSLFVINPLPRMTSMGMDATMDSKEFIDIAGLIEAVL